MKWELLAEADVLGIAITGMVIVFCGLAGISIFIAVLPKILGALHAIAHKTKSASKAPVRTEQHEEELAAITYVIEAERQLLLEEDFRVMGLPEKSFWSFADKMRTLPSKANG